MGAYLGIHEKASIGRCMTVSFTNVATSVFLKPVNWGGTDAPVALNDPPNPDALATFLLTASQDCHIRQGAVTGGAITAATTSDFMLWKQTFLKIVVTGKNDFGLSVIRDSADGTLYIVELTSDTPGSGLSGDHGI